MDRVYSERAFGKFISTLSVRHIRGFSTLLSYVIQPNASSQRHLSAPHSKTSSSRLFLIITSPHTHLTHLRPSPPNPPSPCQSRPIPALTFDLLHEIMLLKHVHLVKHFHKAELMATRRIRDTTCTRARRKPALTASSISLVPPDDGHSLRISRRHSGPRDGLSWHGSLDPGWSTLLRRKLPGWEAVAALKVLMK